LVAERRLPDLLVDLFELGRREDVEATLLPAGDDDAARELLTELRGQDDAAFVVELRSMSPKKHRPVTPFAMVLCEVAPTLLHFPPLLRSHFANSCDITLRAPKNHADLDAWSEVEGNWRSGRGGRRVARSEERRVGRGGR